MGDDGGVVRLFDLIYSMSVKGSVSTQQSCRDQPNPQMRPHAPVAPTPAHRQPLAVQLPLVGHQRLAQRLDGLQVAAVEGLDDAGLVIWRVGAHRRLGGLLIARLTPLPSHVDTTYQLPTAARSPAAC
jgi:hypothetical protein